MTKMQIETPLFAALAFETLEVAEAAMDLSFEGCEAGADTDHALYAFEDVHPHWELELEWEAQAERERFEAFGF